MKAWLWIVVVVACGKDAAPPQVKEKAPEEVKKEWGPKVQAKLEKIVAAAKASEGADLGASDGSAAKLALDFELDETSHPNAIVVQLDDVQSATAGRPKPPPPPSANDLLNAASEGKPIDLTPKHQDPTRFALPSDSKNHVFIAKQLLGIEESKLGPEYWYRQLVDAKYVLVITPVDLQWPEVDGSAFKPGTVRLRGVLVEIDTAKPLGGYETTAASSDTVLVNNADSGKVYVDDNARARVDKRLETDLLYESGKAIKTGIEQRWVGAKMAINWGS